MFASSINIIIGCTTNKCKCNIICLNYFLQVGIGCFGASGNYSSAQGSQDSKSTYDAAKKTLKIEGAQIIGWVCASIPEFPQIKS